jgi:formylglycine-generating enzyme required for sulfatase activity
MTILGDPALATPSTDGSTLVAVPLRAVHLRPFFMDQIELTVGQLRELVADGYDGPLPSSPDGTPDLEHCSWADETLADLPVNCVSVEAAEAICQRRGGALPTEAQWEYAARGRDELRPHVWGTSPPNCCLTAMDRGGQNCPGIGPEAVVSHTEGLTCVGDVSLDGLYDLNGNVAELVRDSLAEYDEPCWIAPRGRVLEDPVCDGAGPRGARGGAWSMSFGEASLAIRRPYSVDASHGFRCVFEAGL